MALTKTRELLGKIGRGTLHPRHAAAWVQEVHGPDDEQALREGWGLRLRTCLGLIEQNAILRDPKRVADLIRGEDTDSLRVIINEEPKQPESPSQREGLNLSRRSLYRLFRDGIQDIGWYWDGSDEQPWKRLQSATDLANTYVVCLRPSVAAYDSDVGFRLGIAGTQESPDRKDPPRPGYAPLRAEPWADHARCVAKEAHRRLEKEHWRTGLLGQALERRYGLTPEAVHDAVTACALLHDLGKLQENWQSWAEAAQRARDSNYQHEILLAHTDFDPEKSEDRERERNLGVRRPPHAPASAYYSGAFLAKLLSAVPEEKRSHVASACAAAVLAHHGGWLPEKLDLGLSKLCTGWEVAVTDALGWTPDNTVLRTLEVRQDKRGAAELLLKATTGPESLGEWWPLVAYLTRTLRLSDQRATAEGALHE
jgi:CRISPR-associated endonuclease Cas3-HD